MKESNDKENNRGQLHAKFDSFRITDQMPFIFNPPFRAKVILSAIIETLKGDRLDAGYIKLQDSYKDSFLLEDQQSENQFLAFQLRAFQEGFAIDFIWFKGMEFSILTGLITHKGFRQKSNTFKWKNAVNFNYYSDAEKDMQYPMTEDQQKIANAVIRGFIDTAQDIYTKAYIYNIQSKK